MRHPTCHETMVRYVLCCLLPVLLWFVNPHTLKADVAKQIDWRRVKGVALDLDGTVLRADQTISVATRIAISRRLRTHRIVLSSARPIRSVLEKAEQLRLPGPMIALNGAFVADHQCVIASAAMGQRALRQLLKITANHQACTWNAYAGHLWLVPRIDHWVATESDIVGFSPDRVISAEQLKTAEKVLMIGPPRCIAGLAQDLKRRMPQLCCALSKPNYLEVTKAGVDKAWGLARFAHHVDLTLKDFAAVGDGDNDAALFRRVGYGVAMGNGTELARQTAQQIIGRVDDDGLADFLNP